jgi:hypothetical protein
MVDPEHLFDLKRPCENCPFRRTGAIELRPGRLAGIVRGLVKNDHEWFHCHKDAYAKRPKNRLCTGAMVYLLKIGQPNLAMRLGAITGMLDYEALRAQFGDIIDAVPPKG